jgi:hypothetical protein
MVAGSNEGLRMNKNMWCVAAVLASGCATMQVQKDKISAAKSLAIVGYSGVLALEDGKQKGGLAGTIGAIKGSADLMSGKLSARRTEQAEVGYVEVSKRLATTLGVAVKEHTALSASQTYAQLMQKSPSTGLRVVGLQVLPDVLQPEVLTTAKPDLRANLATDLGVDALAAVKIRYEVGNTGGFAVAGMGKTTTYPRAVIDFTVYDSTGHEVWHDFFARGLPTKEGLATTMGAEIVANENQVLAEALGTGLDALIEHYQTAK